MTCRIDRLSTEQGLVLHISGRIAAEAVEVVRAALDEFPVVAIEIAAVELVDGDAVKLLAQTEGDGIELRNCPAYIREWIAKERESSS
jgi:anti-anti-sigma regulatory factor